MQVPFSTAKEKVELMHEYFFKHLSIGTARLKEDNETDEEDKQKRVKIESKVGKPSCTSKWNA